MVNDFRCWWQNHYIGDFFRYVVEFVNVFNRSSTSQSFNQQIIVCLQHPSPTSVTNIVVTFFVRCSVRDTDRDSSSLGLGKNASAGLTKTWSDQINLVLGSFQLY